MFWATTGLPRDLPDLLLRPGLVGLEVGHGLHPLAEALLVVEQVGEAQLGVLVLGAPEQGVERAHLDADAAVHAERVVDVEPVELVDRPGLAPRAPRRGGVLVGLDVDAPVGARPAAEHAGRAVLFLEGDDPARPGGGRLLLVRVLHRRRADRRRRDHRLDAPRREQRLGHRLERDPEALDEPRHLRRGHVCHQNATFSTMVARMFTSDRGMRTFHASCWSWSSRNRGYVKRTQKTRNATIMTFTSRTTGPSTFM